MRPLIITTECYTFSCNYCEYKKTCNSEKEISNISRIHNKIAHKCKTKMLVSFTECSEQKIK